MGGGGGLGGATSGLQLTGDERGGKIPGAVGNAGTQSAAYEMITAHCAKFGKTGFITKMDFDSGDMAFTCGTRNPSKPADPPRSR